MDLPLSLVSPVGYLKTSPRATLSLLVPTFPSWVSHFKLTQFFSVL